jgi:tRNA uridine 5-carbamoylmethylation protein Kti12
MKRPPIIFLLGSPGAGKTTFGSRARKELAFRSSTSPRRTWNGSPGWSVTPVPT